MPRRRKRLLDIFPFLYHTEKPSPTEIPTSTRPTTTTTASCLRAQEPENEKNRHTLEGQGNISPSNAFFILPSDPEIEPKELAPVVSKKRRFGLRARVRHPDTRPPRTTLGIIATSTRKFALRTASSADKDSDSTESELDTMREFKKMVETLRTMRRESSVVVRHPGSCDQIPTPPMPKARVPRRGPIPKWD